MKVTSTRRQWLARTGLGVMFGLSAVSAEPRPAQIPKPKPAPPKLKLDNLPQLSIVGGEYVQKLFVTSPQNLGSLRDFSVGENRVLYNAEGQPVGIVAIDPTRVVPSFRGPRVIPGQNLLKG